MARIKVLANIGGEILRFVSDDGPYFDLPDPGGVQRSVFFDSETNQALLDDMNTHSNEYTIGPANILRKNGVAVTVNGPSARYADRHGIGMTALLAKLAAGSPDDLSQAEIKRLFRICLRGLTRSLNSD